jgi:hypothetical protein
MPADAGIQGLDCLPYTRQKPALVAKPGKVRLGFEQRQLLRANLRDEQERF